MKKILAILLITSCLIMLGACNTNAENNETSTSDIAAPLNAVYEFNAKVLEINEQYLLVEPANDSNEAQSSDKIKISLGNVPSPDHLEIGDSVKIAYDGMIQELYPAIIPNVYSLEKN